MSDEDYIALETPGAGPSAGKKRKERTERVNTTIFISSLPYTATTTDLLTHCSFIGPVRHGFVATDKETGHSKGVGYVTYSLLEDAERAITELNGMEFGEKGRKIKVELAVQRPDKKERRELEASRPAVKRPRRTAADAAAGEQKDPNAIRTIILSGVPEGVTKAVLWKKIRKVDDQVEVEYPVEGQSGIAHIVFPSHGGATRAIPKLHGHTYKGTIMTAVLKKRLETLTSGSNKAPSHAGRLIIRNLAWNINEADLRAVFLPFGPIHSITVPTVPSKIPQRDRHKPAPPRTRGFAFVWYLSKKDAEKAMEAVNGQPIHRIGHPQKKEQEERVVAVDWALSKDKWDDLRKQDQDGGVKLEQGEMIVKTEEESDQGSSSEEETGDEESDSGDEDGGEDEGSLSNEEGREEDQAEDVKSEEEDKPTKPALPAVDVGNTLFIRNLPFETTEAELTELFRSFGPLRYARITIDRITGRSRGTGFVCFWKTEHADLAIEEAQRVASETGANSIPLGGNRSGPTGQASKNPFALPSVLTADPSSSVASRLVLHGRMLDLSRAVTREQAGQMKEDGERARHSGDKRNTYLMREGVIFPNSPAAASLPAAELEKRQSSFNARKALLRSNPSLYISKTRLSIRQLPLFVTDRVLKRLATFAVRAFDDEVKATQREDLSRAEQTDETLSASLAARAEKGNSVKGKKGRKERETAVIQAKVVRQQEKMDPLTGAGRSKGYGFLELRSHREALKALRWANNNAEAGKKMWDWWKDEMGDVLERTQKALKDRQNGKEGKETAEELEQRVKRLEARLKEGDDRSEGGMRGGKTLLIEFSIENVQVVKRRVDRISQPEHSKGGIPSTAGPTRDEPEIKPKPEGPRKAWRDRLGQTAESSSAVEKHSSSEKKRDRSDNKKGRKESKQGKKDGGSTRREAKRHAVEDAAKVTEKRGLEKLGDHLGSLIGRKRKMRKQTK